MIYRIRIVYVSYSIYYNTILSITLLHECIQFILYRLISNYIVLYNACIDMGTFEGMIYL